MRRLCLRVVVPFLLACVALGVTGIFGTRVQAATACSVNQNNGQYTTIQSALNAGCTILNIAPGTYSEQISFLDTTDQPYQINGSGAGTIIKHPAPNAATTKQEDGADYVMLVMSTNVLIDNLVIDGGGYSCIQMNTCSSNNLYGIDLHASNNSIHNVTFQNIGDPNSGHFDGNGVGLDSLGDNLYNWHQQDYRSYIQDSTFTNLTRSGVRVRTGDEGGSWGNFANVYFGHNTVNGLPGTVGFENLPHQSLVENNTFQNFTTNAQSTDVWGGTALVIANDAHECINTQFIHNNTFTNNSTGILITGSNNDSVTINNTFNGGGTAVSLVHNLTDYQPYPANWGPIDCQAYHATRFEDAYFTPAINWQQYPIRQDVMNNTINNPGGDGILICSDDYVTISGNTVTGGKGIHVCAGSAQSMLINNQVGNINDASTGAGSLGTANWYSGNTCATATPAGLCGYTDATVVPLGAHDPNWYLSQANCTWFNSNNPGTNPAPCPAGNRAPGNPPPPPATPTPSPVTPTPNPATPTPSPATPTPTPAPVGGAVQVSNLNVADGANAANWSLQTNLQVGAAQYSDRGYTFASIPASLQGSAWVRTAMGSKAFTGTPTVSFTINQSATVYLVLDIRIAPLPSWLDASWTLTPLTVSNNEPVGYNAFVVYSKTFPAGQVALGANSNGDTTVNMYSVAIVGNGASATPTPTPSPATPTPTPSPATPTPTPSPATPTPVSGPVQVSNLNVVDGANAANWSLQTNLQVGAAQYSDRGYTFASIPASLQGAAWVRTAMGSKAFTGSPTVSFTINQSATVYLILDIRIAPLPSWLDASWTLTPLTVSNNEPVGYNAFVVYSKTFPAGQVTLGTNSNGDMTVNMYSVIIK